VLKPTAHNERILPRLIEQELRDSFIDYSMSVIVQRALPDVRDGLKPVHRRILYAMRELGLFPDRGFKKSATVVGDVLGKYHPHGDSAVYDTLVRMVQDFSLRYPLIEGQGNFGSIDGDSAAAYRYTEARLAPVALELLADLENDTVDFVPNFDGRLTEPSVLPARLPNLLLNGSEGIAVGMSTKIPPHNLSELLRATDHLVAHPECEPDELVAHLHGPDFPTGGYIWGRSGIEAAYREGRGLVEMRARMHIEEGAYGKSSLVVTELPYQVNKTRIIEQITKLVRAGRTDAITDLRDESDRDGIRLVIELKRDVNARKLLKTLFLKTQLRCTFGVILLALVDGRPQQLTLKGALERFVDHRLRVIERRATFKLTRAEERAHVLEGLLRALDDIDRVIQLIRASGTPELAARRLEEEFGLSERQSAAILAMRLARLTALESRKLADELGMLADQIERLRVLVSEDGARRSLLREDLSDLMARYGDDRRTEILDDSGTFPLPSGSGNGASLVMISRLGYVKSQPVRGGPGAAGTEALAAREGDFVRQLSLCRGSDQLFAFRSDGNVHALKVGDLPRGTRSSRGHRLAELLGVGDARFSSVLPVDLADSERHILTVTRRGQIKRTRVGEYANVRGGGIIATGLAPGDELVAALLLSSDDEVVIATRGGQAIRFAAAEARAMGRTARGVKGIELAAGDQVVAALAPRRDADLLLATAKGYAKRLPVTELRLQGRAGKGLAILPDRRRAGQLVGLLEVTGDDRAMWELDGGHHVAVEVSRIPRRTRTDASTRVPALEEAAAAEVEVLAVISLRGDRAAAVGAEVESVGTEPTSVEPEPATDSDEAGASPAPSPATHVGSSGLTQGELELAQAEAISSKPEV